MSGEGGSAHEARLDPRAVAEGLRSLDAARHAVGAPEARRRVIARTLDELRDRLRPLPTPAMLVGQVLALPDPALSLLALLIDAMARTPALAQSLEAAWRATADLSREAYGLTPEDGAALAFEALLAAPCREGGLAWDATACLAEAARIEWLLRRVARGTGLSTTARGREEPSDRRAEALARLDPALARAAEERLSLAERLSKAMAALDAELQRGGALPQSAAYARR